MNEKQKHIEYEVHPAIAAAPIVLLLVLAVVMVFTA
jgi:hypothetical protein